MKKEESKVIAQKFQKIPNGTLALKHCRAGGTGTTLFGEQFRAVTAGKGVMEAYETFPGIEVSFNVFLASEIKFQHDASDSVLEIYYCRSGRVGWNMQDGTAVYLGTGDVTAHSMVCCADSAMMFPLGYSEGIHLPGSFKECRCGGRPVTGSILLRKAIRNPVLFRFRAHFCPTLFCSCIRSNFPLEIEGAGNFDLFEQHEIGA